jgi:predicted methyltransferase
MRGREPNNMQRIRTLTAATMLMFAPFMVQAQPISASRIAEIIASPDRSAADRANDIRRKPLQMLAFLAIKPGITALDVSAAGGYTTELLARAVGPTGTVYGQNRPRDPARPLPTPAAPEGNSNPSAAPAPAPAPTGARPVPVTLADRDGNLRKTGNGAPIIAVTRPFEDAAPPELTGKVDLVTLMFNYHDLGWMGVDRAAMNAAVFRALKPGGVFVLADHAGRPGTGISESGTLHRIEPAFLRREIEAAGFKLLAEADFLANPNDPKDKNTPDPAQPKDEYVVKFIKP